MRHSRATTTYLYDGLGRLAMQTDALGNATLWQYDQFDQVTEQALPDSTPEVPRVATYSYDTYGKLISQAGTGQYPVRYTYDGAGNRISLTDGNGSKTQWSYDGLNRVTAKTYQDGSKYQYSYDHSGNLVSRTDAMNRTTNYRYNAYNLVTQVTYPTQGNVSFNYDVLGRRTNMSDSSGTASWQWSGTGENIGYTQSNVNENISYAYNIEAQHTQMTTAALDGSNSWTTSYGYDGAARLTSILDGKVSGTNPFSYAYTPGTNWIAGHSNADGSAVLNQYDVLGRLTSISAANSTKNAINTYSYTYDAAGQRTQEASTVGTRNFNYDDQRQLTSAYRIDNNNNPVPSYTYNYSFDPIGNWTKLISPAGEADISSNGLNQYIKFMGSAIPTPQTPTYDLNGNMLTDGKGNTYVYDEENRLVEADTPNASVPKTISVYDGLSRRVEKRTYDTGGNLVTTTRYLYDGLLPIAEYDANNNLVRSYTRGLDLSGTLQGAGGIGGLLAVTDSTGSYSYFTDGNGNITDLTNVYGTVVSHSEYDPFGNVFASAGSFQQPYGWSSKENDGNRLIYYLYRFYNPSLGRWVNRDPKEEQGGFDLYEFVVNNTIISFDYFGLDSTTASKLGYEWLTGQSAPVRNFFDGDTMVEQMKNTPEVNKARKAIKNDLKNNCAPAAEPLYRSLHQDGFWANFDYAIHTPFEAYENSTRFFLGSYNGKVNTTFIVCCSKFARLHFHITNISSWSSATRLPSYGYKTLSNGQPRPSLLEIFVKELLTSSLSEDDPNNPTGNSQNGVYTDAIPSSILPDNIFGKYGSNITENFDWNENVNF